MSPPSSGAADSQDAQMRGDLGLRTEINVYMDAEGPRVTTPDPQHEVIALPEADG